MRPLDRSSWCLSLVILLVFLGVARSAEADVVARKRILRHFPLDTVCPFRGQHDLWFVATTGEATITFRDPANDGEPVHIDQIDVVQIDEDVFARNYKADLSDTVCWDTEGGAPRFDSGTPGSTVVFPEPFDDATGWTLVNAEIAGGFLRLGLDPGVSSRATVKVTGLVPGKRYYILGSSTNWIAGEGRLTVVVDTPRPSAFFLQKGRFKLEVRFNAADALAGADVYSETSAVFWFNDPGKPELVINVIDHCGDSRTYWLIVGGTTSARAKITVTDTVTGKKVAYQNTNGARFQTRTDKATFRCR